MQKKSLMETLKRLTDGDSSILNNYALMEQISDEAIDLLQKPVWNNDDVEKVDIIYRISNIVYNDTTADVLPLDDGLYDQLLVRYKTVNPNYQVGAQPIQFREQAQNQFQDEKVLCTYVNPKNDDKLFSEDIWKQHTPFNQVRPKNICFTVRDPISKRLINTTHKYPELVGTLDKCKFVLNADAKAQDALNKPAVQVFERDYIHMCLDRGIITPTEEFEMVGELKYDGVSVEAEIRGDTIVNALSRGDTADNIATDLTPILGGYKFPFAREVPKDLTFGMKFEAVITKMDLDRLSIIRQKSYKNCRNAIIGLFGASDAYKYIDYITLIPLSTSLDIPRIDELNFINHYYNSGQYNRFVTMQGNYQTILFQVKQFLESAEYIRPILPYLIDGVVISFTDPKKIKALGRENSVNKYQMAIKFNPSEARTIFLGYTYSIGKSGEVIPMVHFKACEFLGAMHTKQTIHSYERFKDLNLTVGEEIDVKYVNDVITYVTKPDTEYNRNIKKDPVEFIKICPYCGSTIEISESGKSARCPNMNCHERKIMRMVDAIDELGFKDFGEERVRAIDLTEFYQLFQMDLDKLMKVLGPNISISFMNYIDNLKKVQIPDYKIMAALSFDGMGEEKWKIVLKKYTLREIIKMKDDELYNSITTIPGLGSKTAETIISGREAYKNDLEYIVNNLNIVNAKDEADKPKIAITGFRDAEYVDLVNNNGFDCSDKYSVSKQVAGLIAANPSESSTKIRQAQKYGIPIYTRDEFLQANNIIVN